MRWTASLVVAGCLFAAAPSARAQVFTNVYGDVGFLGAKNDEVTASFNAPRLELFLTATQDRLSFLSEVLFEVGDDNEFLVDVERIEVGYLVSDYLRLRAGRFHTAFGYYNDAYHHGAYFQFTVDRPEMVRFEDEGGLIPAHSVGLHADGRLPLGPIGSLRYDLEVANGRGRTPDEVTNVIDPNNRKAVNLRLRLEPGFLDGLILGGNVYFDEISAATGDPMVPPVPVDERMLGAHLVYLENYVHLIAEYLRVDHTTAGVLGTTQAGFVELGYTLGPVSPYARYHRVEFPQTLDPFYAGNVLAQRGSFTAGVGGLRFTISDFLALKFEGGYTKLDRGPSVKTGAVQCAFAF